MAERFYHRRMSRTCCVHLLPSLMEPAKLGGTIAVVIDVLRASTTIAHALAAGAEGVYPCEEVEEARHVAAAHPRQPCILGGERGGRRIAGFDLDNSPAAYTPAAVAGKPVVFTTTNGTRALLQAATADRVLLAAFVNLSAGGRAVRRRPCACAAGGGGRRTEKR
jgi:2-phosphosulfolactate phosphatase